LQAEHRDILVIIAWHYWIEPSCRVRAASLFRAVRYVGNNDNSSAALCIESNLACATHQDRNADSTHPTGIIRDWWIEPV